MGHASSDRFVYQGYKIPLPVSISADHPGRQRTTNYKNIFGCDGHNCNLCEECLIRNLHENSTEVVNRSKVSEKPKKLTERDIERNELEFEIGEGKHITTEMILLAILHKHIEQSELKLQQAANDKDVAKTNTPSVSTTTEVIGDSSHKTPMSSDRPMMSITDIINMNPRKKPRVEFALDQIPSTNFKKGNKEKSDRTNSTNTNRFIYTNIKSPTLASTSSKSKVSKIKQKETFSHSQKQASKKGTVSCYGKIKGQVWGCNRNFESLDALKKHWSDRDVGAQCLKKFIELRRSRDVCDSS